MVKPLKSGISGEGALPKKSVFSRGLGIYRFFQGEISDDDPKLARYHLRYASKLIIKLIFVVVSYVVKAAFEGNLRRVKSAKSLAFARNLRLFGSQ